MRMEGHSVETSAVVSRCKNAYRSEELHPLALARKSRCEKSRAAYPAMGQPATVVTNSVTCAR